MKRKPIKVDWDELEAAFDNSDPELLHYLDRITGHVLLEGEGEEDSFERDETSYDRGGATARARPEDTTRVRVPTLTTEQKLEWVGRFVDDSPDLDPEVSANLAGALVTDNPVHSVLEVLNANPEVKESWYLYRTERLHETVERWVEEQEIVVSTPPPWK
jgi:hypothetical protein